MSGVLFWDTVYIVVTLKRYVPTVYYKNLAFCVPEKSVINRSLELLSIHGVVIFSFYG